jgi:thiol-disulfide isomerase/thioredoxin
LYNAFNLNENRIILKKILLSILGLVALLVVACEDSADGRTIQGEPIVFKDHQVIVVTYWAKWCHLCKGNIPIFNALQSELQEKVMVLGVDFDDSPIEPQQKIAQEFHIEYPLLKGPLKGIDLPTPDNIPVTYILRPHTHSLYSTLTGSLDLYTLKETVKNAYDEAD